MTEEGSDLLHLGLFSAGGAEAEWLVVGGGGDEGLVVPEANGVGDGGVALAEEVLELVNLEEVGDCLVAAIDAALALPPLVAHLLSLLRLCRSCIGASCRRQQQKHKHLLPRSHS